MSNGRGMRLYDVNRNAAYKPPAPPANQSTEYYRQVEVSKSPDTFPCGHVLCHQCIRKHVRRDVSALYCPVCRMKVHLDLPEGAASMAYEQEEAPNITLLSNFGEIVKKFNGISYNLRRLKDETVQSRSMGMTFTNTHCDLCREHHGTLRVIQEHNRLQVRHERPTGWTPYFYRLTQGRVVTEFYTKVNSACICVPCSYKELRMTHKFPELEGISERELVQKPQTALAEVGKIVAKNMAPIMALQGKNVIEIDHKIRVRERADQYDFRETTDEIERMVRQQEDSLIRMAHKQIRDTGRLYHVQESNEVEIDMDETAV